VIVRCPCRALPTGVKTGTLLRSAITPPPIVYDGTLTVYNTLRRSSCIKTLLSTKLNLLPSESDFQARHLAEWTRNPSNIGHVELSALRPEYHLPRLLHDVHQLVTPRR